MRLPLLGTIEAAQSRAVPDHKRVPLLKIVFLVVTVYLKE